MSLQAQLKPQTEDERPPAYTRDPEKLDFPTVPNHDPAAHTTRPDDFTLPDIKSLTLPQPNLTAAHTSAHPPRALSLGGSTPDVRLSVESHGGNQSGHTYPRMEVASPTEAGSVMSLEEQSHRATSVVSLDDPDVREAAEALSGLGKMHYVRSPAHRNSTLPVYPDPHDQPTRQEQETLLNMVSSNYPMIGGAINGSINAYAATKARSPNFVQYYADVVERNIASPVASTVASVGRRTGMEGRIRGHLGARRPSDLERSDSETIVSGNKRRRLGDISPHHADVEQGLRSPSVRSYHSRRESQVSVQEPLPAYDENMSPKYEEQSTVMVPPTEHQQHPGHNRSWSTRVMISTSGLGAALHDPTMRSLQYCFGVLSGAAHQLGSLMRALRQVLDDYDRMLSGRPQGEHNAEEKGLSKVDSAQQDQKMKGGEEAQDSREQEAARVAERIKAINNDIMNTIRASVDMVNRYTGGLTGQASEIVRRQLLSIPFRYQAVSRSQEVNSQAQSNEVSKTGHRMLAFAKEGLDVMAAVSAAVEDTINRAESWANTFGRRRKEESSTAGDQKPPIDPALEGVGVVDTTVRPNGDAEKK